jgi:phage minor structural protein
MLIITDIFGNTEALTDFQNVEINEEVNGDFSLSFTCLLTEKNAHSYPLVQEESIVELDGHEFRIKKMVEVKNRKQIIAQHLFFETIDNQIYDINGGTLSLDAAAAFALNGSGWTFENADVIESRLIPNFGEGNTVSLVIQICSDFVCDRKILPGRHLRFETKIGEDNDQQFRYKHNIKTLKRTVDTTRFCTVLKGYGADGLVVEYRSPNIAIYGERHGEPIRDERFTNPESLLEKCKQSIQDVPEVSIEVELSQMGFDAQLGDKVWLIYEPLNLEFQTRIMSVKSWPFLKKSPVVELSNRKHTFTNMLAQIKTEIKEAKKETRSKFEQTNEKFSFEVNRIDESIGTLQIEADNIVLNVQAIDSRLGTAEGQISVQAGQLALKVSQTDYNANTIASLINMSPTAIDIESQKLNLKGYITATSLENPGQTIIHGSNIKTGSMSADAIFGGWLRLSHNSSIYEETQYGTELIFSSANYRFETNGGTIDFGNNAVTGLNVTVSFG